MITVSELSSNIFLIKSDVEVTAEELLKLPEIIKLIGRAKFELKPGDHDIWILRLNLVQTVYLTRGAVPLTLDN